jgi:hypothetical protein
MLTTGSNDTNTLLRRCCGLSKPSLVAPARSYIFILTAES